MRIERIVIVAVLCSGAVCLAQPTTQPAPAKKPATQPAPAKTPATRPAAKATSQPTSRPAPPPDLCKDAIDPWSKGRERARFFKAAGVNGELDANEYKVDANRPNGFVRKFDRWTKMLRHDENENKMIGWSEAEKYRLEIRKQVLGMFDESKDGKLTGAERDRANRFLNSGRFGRRGGWRGRRGRGELPKRMKEYDTDGDGKLSPAERAAMWKKRRAAREQLREQAGDEYDTDGDGEISDEEMQAARDEWRELRRQSRLERYDTDGDGELDSEERQAMYEEMRVRFQRWRQDADDWRLQLFDSDNDGEIGEEERKTFRNFRDEAMGTVKDLFTRAVDADGDGNVSDEERAASRQKQVRVGFRIMLRARQKMDLDSDGEVSHDEQMDYWNGRLQQSQKWVEDFTDEYDTDADGRFDDEERQAMLGGLQDEMRNSYGSADSDGDGLLDEDETVEFSEDLMGRMSFLSMVARGGGGNRSRGGNAGGRRQRGGGRGGNRAGANRARGGQGRGGGVTPREGGNGGGRRGQTRQNQTTTQPATD